MKKWKLKNNKVLEFIFSYVLIIISAIIFALAIKMFVSPKKLLSGGLSGVSLIFGRLVEKFGGPKETQIAGIINFTLNAPLLILSWFKLNKRFTIFSATHVIVSSIVLALVPDNITAMVFGENSIFVIAEEGMLDAAIFAGALAGCSTAVAFTVGGSSAGADIISYYLSSRKQMTVGKINTIINGLIILISIVLFPEQGISHAMYTIIYILTNAMCIDAIYIRNRKTTLSIVTNKGEEVSKFIMSKFYRGVTILDGKGAYTGNHKDFLYVVTTSFEAMNICKEVQKFDPDCFITVSSLEKVFGRFINKEVH